MKLKELRLKAGLSCEKVARQLDVSSMTIRNWESKETEPSASQVKALAKLFGVTADYLLE